MTYSPYSRCISFSPWAFKCMVKIMRYGRKLQIIWRVDLESKSFSQTIISKVTNDTYGRMWYLKRGLHKQLKALIWETRGSRTWCRRRNDPPPGIQSVPLHQLVPSCAKLNLYPPSSRLLPSQHALGLLGECDGNNMQEQMAFALDTCSGLYDKCLGLTRQMLKSGPLCFFIINFGSGGQVRCLHSHTSSEDAEH